MNEIQRTIVSLPVIQFVAPVSRTLTTSGRKSNVLLLETGVSYISRSIDCLLLGNVNQVRCTRRSINCGDEK